MLDEKNVIYQDKYLLVVNKPAGMLTVPTPKNEKYTLLSLLKSLVKKINSQNEVFACHRLDRQASGLIIFAKSKDIRDKIMQQFKNRQVKKKYIAFVQGRPKIPRAVINFPLENKKAVTKYKLLQTRKGYSIIEAEPVTGRTNQIRIHFKMLGHPLLGERKFALGRDAKVKFRRVALHAAKIQFIHPVEKRMLSFCLRLPDDMHRLVGSFKY
jgi:23S rRNA pseudouridine1911/1915/1917 synthase